MSDDKARKATAYHEAGHAAAAFLELGQDALHIVSIASNDEDGTLGRVHHDGFGFSLDPQTDLRWTDELSEQEIQELLDTQTPQTEYARLARVISHIVVSLAGYLVERRYAGVDNQFGSGEDRKFAAHTAVAVCSSEKEAQAFISWLELRTETLIQSKTAEVIIPAIAEALLERETLTGQEVAQVAGQALLDEAKARMVKEEPL